ncbi:unnamed protein product [Candida verbasci]|uniref:THO complex subunit 2 n=1 Tax=Candida verbasci TaxID=1227364 RepID=A0A9W4XF96_9ASCO|nr:unnamed protein product [Candida verbasci]
MSEHTYVSDEILEDFQNGSASLIEHIESYEENNLESELKIAEIFQELLSAYEEESINQNQLIDFLSTSIKNDSIARIFCQIFNEFDNDEKFTNLLNILLSKTNLLKAETLARYISADVIKKSNLVTPAAFTKKVNNSVRSEFLTQKKYNLIHEETEGYSRFVIELYYIFKYEEIADQTDYVLQVIEKLIGHYNLDPNRCLELLLEVFSDVIVSHCQECLNLLRKSRWWPIEESDNSSLSSLSKGGSEKASKIFGLRLMKYPDGKDLPETYKSLIAILIKEGFLSFGAIFKYLKPDDESMKVLDEAYKSKLNEEVVKAGANALALAAPLADDEEDGQPKKKEAEKKVEKPVDLQEMLHTNQIYQLLRVLISNGVYYPSVFILSKYPYLANIDSEITELMNRLIEQCLDPFYNKIQSFTDDELRDLQEMQGIAYSRPNNGVSYEPVEIFHILSFKPTIIDFGQKKYIYFYRNWIKKLPAVEDFNSLKQFSIEFLNFQGPKISENLPLVQKLCECVLHHFQNHPEDRDEVFFYFRNFIFPVMPLIEENSIVIDKAYSILAPFSLEERFSLYGELYNNLRKNNPLIQMAYSKAVKSTKDVLKRLSKENVRPMMRRLAKISFSNPLACLLTVLQQVESYDNLIPLIVETARYFNDYGWDNLTAAILIRLSSNRSSTQHHGMVERQWIQSLASFIGRICQRYPKAIDIKTILKFIIEGFKSGDNIGVLILREMFTSMGGIQSITNLTIHQIDMINSGSSLQKIIYRNIDDLRYERTISGNHLINSITELNAINEILVYFCSIANDLVFDSDENHLKILSSKDDDLTAVIRLFTTLISFFNHENDQLDSIKNLQKTGIPLKWGFEIWRSFIQDVNDLIELKPQEIASGKLFAYFWKLTLHDINYSETLYDGAIVKLESNVRSLNESISINLRKSSDLPKEKLDQMRDQLYQNEEFLKQIPKDKDVHKEENEKIDQEIIENSVDWFKETQINKFIELCVIPRAIHSSFDAVFVSRFLFKLHTLKIEKYSIVSVLDQLFKSKLLFGILYSSTSTESENLGLLIADILRTLQQWIDNEIIDENLPDLDSFKSLVHEYHSIILEEIETSFRSDEYMARSSTITFTKNLLAVYPIVDDHCNELVKLIANISQTETREDLKLASSALLGQIKLRAKDAKLIWDVITISEEEKQNIIEEKERKAKREDAKKLALIAKEEKVKKLREERLGKEKQQREEEKLLKKRAASSNLYTSSNAVGTRPDSRATSYPKLGKYDDYARTTTPKLDLPTGPSKEPTPRLKQRVEELKENYQKEKSPVMQSQAKPENTKLESAKPEIRKAEDEKVKDAKPNSQSSSSSVPSVKRGVPLKPQQDEIKIQKQEEEKKEQSPPLKRTPLPPQDVVLSSESAQQSFGFQKDKVYQNRQDFGKSDFGKPDFGNHDNNRPFQRKSFDNSPIHRSQIPQAPPAIKSDTNIPMRQYHNGFKNSFNNQQNTRFNNNGQFEDTRSRQPKATFDNRQNRNFDNQNNFDNRNRNFDTNQSNFDNRQNPNKRKGDFNRNYDNKRPRN